MAFDVETMADFCMTAVKEFAATHQDESFYSFAVDAALLCLNTEDHHRLHIERLTKEWESKTRPIASISSLSPQELRDVEFTLKIAAQFKGLDRSDEAACVAAINESRAQRREEGCSYLTPEMVEKLRRNTGDWKYQGFAQLDNASGFDEELYEDHYDKASQSNAGEAPNTLYAKAMNKLIKELGRRDAFACLTRTPDFVVTWVEHG